MTITDYKYPTDYKCPYEFTGNAHPWDEWQACFVAAYQFAMWGEEMAPKHCGVRFSSHISHRGTTADGITLYIEDGWAADAFQYYLEVLAKIPCWPDGDLTINNYPGDDKIIFHLWYD